MVKITSFSQKIIQSLNEDASELIEDAKKVPQGSVQQRICVEELDLIRLFQTGRQPMRGLFCIFRLRMCNAATVMMIFSCTSIRRLDNRFPV